MKTYIDIFCNIIDNYGDIGVLYRLAKDIIKIDTNIEPRIYTNKIEEVKKLNNQLNSKLSVQTINGITYINLDKLDEITISNLTIAPFIIEGFGCEIPKLYLNIALKKNVTIINLEYITAENWIEDYHLMPSIINSKTTKKYFFMPGFTKKSGGVIIDYEFITLRDLVQNNKKNYYNDLMSNYSLNYKYQNNRKYISIFSYEHNFNNFMEYILKQDENYILLILGDKSQKSFDRYLSESNFNQNENINCEFIYMPFVNQEEYDIMLNICDFNIIRGEDSFIRALLSRKAFLWHIYLQDEMYHMEKLNAFLEKASFYFKNKKTFDIYSNILYNFNYREENSFEISLKDDYIELFENSDKIERSFSNFADFLIKECNLTKNLINFINKQKSN